MNCIESAQDSHLSTARLDEIVALARAAGDAIMAVYRGDDLGISHKSDASPLTLADLAAHQVITAGLHRFTPQIPILSEEDFSVTDAKRHQWTLFWLIDPLDGTKEFINRNGEFTVNIALIENGVPVLGVVYAPARDVCYYAAQGLGAFVQHNQLPAQPIYAQARVEGEMTKVVASRSHCDDRTRSLLNELGSYECISMGSSLKLCLVAEGVAHFYPRLGPTMEWDTAAAHAIVNEAGGIVCDVLGQSLTYNKSDMHNPAFFVLSATSQALAKTIREWHAK